MRTVNRKHYFSNERVEEACASLVESHINRLFKSFKKDIPDKNKIEGNVVFKKYSPISVSDNNSD